MQSLNAPIRNGQYVDAVLVLRPTIVRYNERNLVTTSVPSNRSVRSSTMSSEEDEDWVAFVYRRAGAKGVQLAKNSNTRCLLVAQIDYLVWRDVELILQVPLDLICIGDASS